MRSAKCEFSLQFQTHQYRNVDITLADLVIRLEDLRARPQKCEIR